MLDQIDELSNVLPKREATANKGDFGHVLVIGGDYGMAGAVRMAAEAAARTGAGLVTVATHPEHVMIVNSMRPELMCYSITKKAALTKLIERATVIVLGPGLGQSKWSKQLFAATLNARQPKIIDADALNLLAKNNRRSDDWILTPHPGEAGRLLGCSAAEIQQDRYAAARAIQAKFGGVCVLKGAGTLIAGTLDKVWVAPYANPAMASAGMGDILSGIISGLLAQGLAQEDAARFAVIMHAEAAKKAAARRGERGVLALDLVEFI